MTMKKYRLIPAAAAHPTLPYTNSLFTGHIVEHNFLHPHGSSRTLELVYPLSIDI